MTIDASIPLQVKLYDFLDDERKRQQIRESQFGIEQKRTEAQQKSRLSELLPKAFDGDKDALTGVAQADPELYMKVKTHLGTLGSEGAKREKAKWDAAGPVLARAKAMPYETRRAFIQQAAPILMANGWSQEELAGFDPTDQAVDAMSAAGMTMAQVLDSQKVTWHPVGERGSFATDNMGNPTGEGNPFAGGATPANIPPPPAGFVINGGPASQAPGTFP